jgi:hypothetical protein
MTDQEKHLQQTLEALLHEYGVEGYPYEVKVDASGEFTVSCYLFPRRLLLQLVAHCDNKGLHCYVCTEVNEHGHTLFHGYKHHPGIHMHELLLKGKKP